MTLFLIITALTVSIDSLVCGFTLSMRNVKRHAIVLGIALTVFLMCALVNYSTVYFENRLNQKTACFGGLLLVGVGVYNLIKKNDCDLTKKPSPLKQSILIGLAVGTDGAVANLSLALMGINQFYVPLTIAVCHALMISLGILLSQTKLARKFAKIEFMPQLILIALGIYKTLGLFI